MNNAARDQILEEALEDGWMEPESVQELSRRLIELEAQVHELQIQISHLAYRGQR